MAALRPGALLLAVLCLATLAYWSIQYQPFLLPNNDYYSFEREARSFARGELPHSFRRMPLMPASMALLAPAMPGPHPELQAALALNMLLSIALLVALYDLGRRTLGPAALIPVVLMACTVEFHAMGLQPLVEPSYAFFVVTAFALLARRSSWQYLAAAGAALSRYEGLVLLAVLGGVNAVSERRPRPHLARGFAASVPALAWVVLGAVHGSGVLGYLELMEGMHFRPAPHFLLHYLREPFAGLYDPSPAGALALLAALGVVGWGVRRGWRSFRRETLAMLLFLPAFAVVVVVSGFEKPRYAYPSEWILLFFFGAGCWAAAEALRGAAARRGPGAARALAMAFALGAAALVAVGMFRLARVAGVAPPGANLLFAGSCLGVAAVCLRNGLPPGGAPRAAAVALGLALLAPMMTGGIRGSELALHGIQEKNRAAAVLAGWLQAHLPDDARVVVLTRSEVLFLTDIRRSRIALFAEFDAADAQTLAEAMRRRGYRFVGWTWRRPASTPRGRLWRRLQHVDLADAFADGGPVEGFEHVATLPLPAGSRVPPVQIYRLRDGPAADRGSAPEPGRGARNAKRSDG